MKWKRKSSLQSPELDYPQQINKKKVLTIRCSFCFGKKIKKSKNNFEWQDFFSFRILWWQSKEERKLEGRKLKPDEIKSKDNQLIDSSAAKWTMRKQIEEKNLIFVYQEKKVVNHPKSKSFLKIIIEIF